MIQGQVDWKKEKKFSTWMIDDDGPRPFYGLDNYRQIRTNVLCMHVPIDLSGLMVVHESRPSIPRGSSYVISMIK